MTAGNLALYGTVWLALALFVLGLAGQRSKALATQPPWRWWWLWSIGALLCAVHMVLAVYVRYGWSHAAAADATAVQTQAVYGVRWAWSVYVNYLFVGVWLAEIAWWRISPSSFFGRPRTIAFLVRAFYLLIIVNATIVFAAPSRRVAGLFLVLALVWMWTWQSAATRHLRTTA
jgi:hypothetical protein